MKQRQFHNIPGFSKRGIILGCIIVVIFIFIGGSLLARKQIFAVYYDFQCDEYTQNKKYVQAIDYCTKALEWEPTVKRYYNRAHVYTQYRDYERAIADYTTVIELTPQDAQGYAYRGLTRARSTRFFMKNDYEQAIIDYSQALSLAPELIWVYGFRGRAYFSEGAYTEAIVDFTTALTKDPERMWGYYEERGLSYANQRQYEYALKDYTAFIQRCHESQKCLERQQLSSVYLYRGYVYTILGEYTQALKDYLAAIQDDPGLVDLYYVSGVASYTGQQDYAITEFADALQQESNNAAIHFGKAVACEQAGRLSDAFVSYHEFLHTSPVPPPALVVFAQKRMTAMWEIHHPFSHRTDEAHALQNFTKVLERDPTNVIALLKRGQLYTQQGHYDQAIINYSNAIAIDPKNAFAHTLRGNAYRGIRDYEHALADYTRSIDLDPEDYWTTFYRAQLYFSQGAYQATIADLTRMLNIKRVTFPKDRVYLWRGYVYTIMAKYDNALADYTEAIIVNTENVNAYLCRGDVYSDTGNSAQALADYRNVLKISPRSERINSITRGLAYDHQSEYSHAILEYTNALKQDAKEASAYALRGLTYAARGKYEQALSDYTQAAELAVNSKKPGIVIEQGFLYVLQGKYPQAMEAFRDAITQNSHFRYAPNFSEQCSHRGKYNHALLDVISALESLSPTQPEVSLSKALAYEKAERYDNALNEYQIFLQQLDPQDIKLIEFAQHKIAELKTK